MVDLCRKTFKWAQVHKLAENVASMDYDDCSLMNEAYEDSPWYIDSLGVSLCRRPRLYWVSWELVGWRSSMVPRVNCLSKGRFTSQ